MQKDRVRLSRSYNVTIGWHAFISGSTAVLVACQLQLGLSRVEAQPPAVAESTAETNRTVQVVPATDALLEAAGKGGDTIRQLIEAARPTLGVPYEWGGTQLEKGVDCSGYTWQLFRKIGLPYNRYLDTRALSQLKEAHGLRRIAYEEAVAGDLLVYGCRDEAREWHGHVVILVDKDGQRTGHKGLVLGAHGPPVDAVQFITFTGFEEGFYKTPQKRLCNVLRVDGSEKRVDEAAPSGS